MCSSDTMANALPAARTTSRVALPRARWLRIGQRLTRVALYTPGHTHAVLLAAILAASVLLATLTYASLNAQNQAIARLRFRNIAAHSVSLIDNKLGSYASFLQALRRRLDLGELPTKATLLGYLHARSAGGDSLSFTLLARTMLLSADPDAWHVTYAYGGSQPGALALRVLQKPPKALLPDATRFDALFVSSPYKVKTLSGVTDYVMLTLPVKTHQAGEKAFINLVISANNLFRNIFPENFAKLLRVKLYGHGFPIYLSRGVRSNRSVFTSIWSSSDPILHSPPAGATPHETYRGFVAKEALTLGSPGWTVLVSARHRSAFLSPGERRIVVAGTAMAAIPGLLLIIAALYLGAARRNVKGRVRERARALAGTKRDLEIEIARRERLEREIIEVSEAQRRRFGRELHDDLGQKLTATRMMLERVKKSLANNTASSSAVAVQINKIDEYLADVTSQARSLARGLNPIGLESRGIFQAVGKLCAKVQECTGVDCIFEYVDAFDIHDRHIATHLYRISQEAVNNAAKHASASLIKVRVAVHRGVISMIVADDGSGITNPAADTMGLQIMRYRAGIIGARFKIISQAGRGTIVAVRMLSTVSLQS